MKKAAIYSRISQADPDVDAIADQIRRCTELAKAEGYMIVAEYHDDGISAFKGKTRPGFLELVTAIRSGKVDVVLAVAEDRLTRSSAEKIGLQSDCSKAGVVWHTVAGGRVDPGTAAGGLLGTITGAIGEYESHLRAERVAASVQRRLAEGRDLGGPRPFGWESDRLTIRESEADLVREAHRMILQGGSIYSIAKAWEASGLKPPRSTFWRTQTVRSVLLRPRNAGILSVSGKSYGQALPALVSLEDHEAVTAILMNPDRAPRRGPVPTSWTASGYVRCGSCGSYLRQTAARPGRAMKCAREAANVPGRHPSIEATKLESLLANAAWGRVTELAVAGGQLDGEAEGVAGLRLRIAELSRQRDVLQVLAVQPGANVPMALKAISALGEDLTEAQRELDHALASDERQLAVELAKEYAIQVGGRVVVTDVMGAFPAWLTYWEGLTVAQRRGLLRGLFGRVELHLTTATHRLVIDGEPFGPSSSGKTTA